MSSIITNQFRKALADAVYDDIFSRRNKYYHYFGKSATDPAETPIDTAEYQADIRNVIVGAKRIYSSDVAYVVPRFNWTSGEVYKKYRTDFDGIVIKTVGATTVTENFYVYNESNYSVYKCIDNAKGAVSTHAPEGSDPIAVTYPDGYVWKYLYTIPQSMRDRFLTDEFIPVFNALRAQHYTDGGISKITIINSGEGYNPATTSITINGDGVGAEVLPVIVDGTLSDVIIKNPGTNYTNIKLTVNGGSTPASIIAELGGGDLDTPQALVELLTTKGTIDSVDVVSPGAALTQGDISAKIVGDGKGATVSLSFGTNPSGDYLDSVVITNSGSGYTWANVVFTNSGGGSTPTARANVSPAYGQASDTISELYASTLMIHGEIDTNGFPGYPTGVDVTYDQYGILKNPRNYELSSNIHNQVAIDRYQTEASIEPIVQFIGGGGYGAKGRANVVAKHVSNIFVQDGGIGYSATPVINIDPPPTATGNYTATAIAKLRASVSSVSLLYGGVGYKATPGVSITSTSGNGAVVNSSIGQGVGAVAITNQGSGYTTAPDVTFVGGEAAGTQTAQATAVVSGGKIVKINITSPGNYTTLPTVAFSSGTAVGDVVPTFCVTSLSKIKSGDYYEEEPGVSFGKECGISDVIVEDSGREFGAEVYLDVPLLGGGGTGAQARAYINDCVRYVTIINGGSGYSSVDPPEVAISGSTGTGATGVAIVSGGKVVGVEITNRGSGYTTTPTVTFSGGGGGDGASASCVVARGISHVNITDPGSGYNSAPAAIVPTSGNRDGFALKAVLGVARAVAGIQGSIKEVQVTSVGSGYESVPSINIVGGSPIEQAILYPKVVGEVQSITIDDAGTGYTSKPTVVISGGEGSGASFIANISAGGVNNCVKVLGGNNYVITKYEDFLIGDVLEDDAGNDFVVYQKMRDDVAAFILQSNDGATLTAGTKLRKKNESGYFITSKATSHKLLETRFPIACYKARGSFSVVGDSVENGSVLTLADVTNGDKRFIVIHQREVDGQKEMLLSSIDGGKLNIGTTLTSGAKSFLIGSYDAPEIDKRSGDLLVTSGKTAFTQNGNQSVKLKTILSFAGGSY